MQEIVFRLPFLLPTRNQQDRMHFQEKKKLKGRLVLEIRGAGIMSPVVPLEHAEIVVWRHSIMEPDADGLWGSLKQLLDVLQPEGALNRRTMTFPNPGGLGIIATDKPSCVSVRPLWVKAPNRTAQHTIVRIRELVDAEAL